MTTDVAMLKDYFKKLRTVVLTGADFCLFNVAFIKKNKIDDILCCILAILPTTYKKYLHTQFAKPVPTMHLYDLLYEAIKQRCLFNSQVYMVDKKRAIKYISNLISGIERDLIYLEKNS